MNEDFTIDDETNPAQIKLYTRSSTADTNWVYLADATSINANDNKATFSAIAEFCQFIIGKHIGSPDTPQNVTIEIYGNNIQLSWNKVSGANSYKIFACDTPTGTFGDVTSSESSGSTVLSFSANSSPTFRAKSNSKPNPNTRATQRWTTTVSGDEKFYYVVAFTDSGIVRSRMIIRQKR